MTRRGRAEVELGDWTILFAIFRLLARGRVVYDDALAGVWSNKGKDFGKDTLYANINIRRKKLQKLSLEISRVDMKGYRLLEGRPPDSPPLEREDRGDPLGGPASPEGG